MRNLGEVQLDSEKIARAQHTRGKPKTEGGGGRGEGEGGGRPLERSTTTTTTGGGGRGGRWSARTSSTPHPHLIHMFVTYRSILSPFCEHLANLVSTTCHHVISSTFFQHLINIFIKVFVTYFLQVFLKYFEHLVNVLLTSYHPTNIISASCQHLCNILS